jgi:phage-related protein
MRVTTRATNWTRCSAVSSLTILNLCPRSAGGVEEIRVMDESGAYRVIDVARRAEAVYVLHAFQKKTQATSKRDIETAKRRLAQLSRGRK